MQPILERLKNSILICDGAAGTMLFSQGFDPCRCFEHLSVERPDVIKDLHKQYLDAGADILETNTFGANASQLSKFGYAGLVVDINKAAAEIARAVAGSNAYVAGSIGPLDKFSIEKHLSDQAIYDIYAQQATALADGGVDLIFLETFSNLEHIKIALAACKKETVLPVFAQMALLDGLRTSYGNSLHAIVKGLEEGRADGIGANCGSGPATMKKAVAALAALTDAYISAQPNAGYPRNIDGRSIYLTAPGYFAQHALEAAESGANIIGGCCGTTPEHIRSIAKALKGRKPVPRPQRVSYQETAVQQRQAFFGNASREKPGFIVELLPPKQNDVEKLIDTAAMLKSSGAETISFPENPMAQVRMNAIVAAGLVQKKTGLTSIFHYTCRDRNLISLQSDILGACALGLTNVLAVTGDPASLGNNPGASSVFDVDSIKLVKLIADMKRALKLDMRIGVAFNPNFDDMSGQLQRLKRKIDAGAEFVMTQPMFETDKIKKMSDEVNPLGVPVYLGVLPLVSRKNAEFLHNEVPGMKIPDPVRQRMDIEDKLAAQKEGIEIALELIRSATGRVSGFYLISPLHKYEITATILKTILV